MDRPAAPHLVNALTVDVEDYFQVSALAPHFPRARWDCVPCRVERNVERVLELLAAASARALFPAQASQAMQPRSPHRDSFPP